MAEAISGPNVDLVLVLSERESQVLKFALEDMIAAKQHLMPYYLDTAERLLMEVWE